MKTTDNMTQTPTFDFKSALSKGKEELNLQRQVLLQEEQIVKQVQAAQEESRRSAERYEACKTLAEVFNVPLNEVEDWLHTGTFIPSWLQDDQGYYRWEVHIPGIPENIKIFVTHPPFHDVDVYLGSKDGGYAHKIERLADLAIAMKEIENRGL